MRPRRPSPSSTTRAATWCADSRRNDDRPGHPNGWPGRFTPAASNPSGLARSVSGASAGKTPRRIPQQNARADQPEYANQAARQCDAYCSGDPGNDQRGRCGDCGQEVMGPGTRKARVPRKNITLGFEPQPSDAPLTTYVSPSNRSRASSATEAATSSGSPMPSSARPAITDPRAASSANSCRR